MASTNRRLIWNTLERLLSTDLETMGDLVNANLDNTAVACTAGVAGLGGGFGTQTPVSAVIDGLQVQPNNPGVDLVVRVNPGLAYKVQAAAGTYDSLFKRIELTAAATLDLSALVAAQPRWVAIEIAPADAVELVALRDIWQPALGTFTTANVDKVRRPAPVITANAGAPAASPVLPDGTTGTIPLAYVYLAGGAVSLALTDIVWCRPLYSNLGTVQVSGGGIHVATAGGSQFSPSGQRGGFSQGARYTVSTGLTWDATAPIWAVGEGWALLGVANDQIYVYVCTAPYPTGYDSDVVRRTREFTNFTTHIPSAPVPTQPYIILSGGAPGSVSFTGGRSLTSGDPVWGTGGSVTANETHYLGTLSYVLDAAGLAPQRTERADVRLLAPMTDPLLQAAVSAGAGLTVFADFFPGDVKIGAVPPGNGGTAPLGTRRFLLGLDAVCNGATGYATFYDGLSAGNVFSQWSVPFGTTEQAKAHAWAYVSPGGTCRAEVANTAGGGSVDLNVYHLGYLDPYLALR